MLPRPVLSIATVFASLEVDLEKISGSKDLMQAPALFREDSFDPVSRVGRVSVRYTPVGTGGARCYTTEQLQPGFRGPTKIR